MVQFAFPSKGIDIIEDRDLAQDHATDHVGRLKMPGVDRRGAGAACWHSYFAILQEKPGDPPPE